MTGKTFATPTSFSTRFQLAAVSFVIATSVAVTLLTVLKDFLVISHHP